MLKKLQVLLHAIPCLTPRLLAVPLAALLLVIGLGACSSTSESGGEGGGGEESATQFGPMDTFDEVRKGARLVLRYDAETATFQGEVTNTTDAALQSVRVEVHMRSGTQVIELGPTEPMDLAPGQTITVRLPIPGYPVDSWGAHAEVGVSTGGGEGGEMHAGEGGGMESMLEFGDWAVLHDDMDTLRIASHLHGLSAEYTAQGPMLTPAAPEHQPTVAATWNGEWFGRHASTTGLQSGPASVAVSIGATNTAADLTLQDVPTLGTLRWDDMSVSNGRFMGDTTADAQPYGTVGQFGGADQAGVVGHASGPDFRSVFFGEKN